jgi:hypothetical protein
MKDMMGFDFTEGDKVARAVMWGKSPMLEICTVTKIKDGKIYLNESKQYMRFPERLLIIEQEEIGRMMKHYEMSKALKEYEQNSRTSQ